MYVKKTYRFKDSIEHEYSYAGKYGARGEKRSPKKKPTKEQIKRQPTFSNNGKEELSALI